MDARRAGVRTVLQRGWRKRCPHCGQGTIFGGWYTLLSRCAACGFLYEPRGGDTWGLMYVSTAFLTGVILVGMLLLTPDNLWIGRALVLLAWLILIFATLPNRKGMAISLEYLLRRRARAAGSVDAPPPPLYEDKTHLAVREPGNG